MKIAFDVKGTIDGYNEVLVLKLLRAMKAAGHQVVVWSNSVGFAKDAVEKHKLDVPYQWKEEKSSFDCAVNPEEHYFDLAIEDDMRQTYLAAKEFLWVHEINEGNIDDLIKKYGEKNG